MQVTEQATQSPALNKYPARKRVLIIEDDPAQEVILNAIFHDIDPKIEIDYVTSGEAAVQRIKEAKQGIKRTPYDLIVADIFLEGKMSGIDFWDICQNIFPNMPAVVMSVIPLRKFFYFIGSNNVSPPFLQKPLNLYECRQTFKRLLDHG